MNCFDCKYFKIWDGDPCCLSPKGWKIILPIEIDCKEFEERTKKVPDVKQVWSNVKREFFTKFTVKSELAKRYLLLYPEDKNLIGIEDENSKTESSN